MLRCLFALALLGSLAAFAVAQPGPTPMPSNSYSWWKFPGDPDHFYLYQGQRQIGGFDKRAGVYRELLTDTGIWGDPCEPPTPLPYGYALAHPRRMKNTDAPPAVKNFGVDQGKLAEPTTNTGYQRKGADVTPEVAYQAIEDGKLTDDSGKLRLSFIGDEPSCKAALADYQASPLMTDLRDKVICRAYRPDDPVIAARKLTAKGPGVTVYLSRGEGGKALYAATYSGPGDFASIRAAALGNPLLGGPSDFVAWCVAGVFVLTGAGLYLKPRKA